MSLSNFKNPLSRSLSTEEELFPNQIYIPFATSIIPFGQEQLNRQNPCQQFQHYRNQEMVSSNGDISSFLSYPCENFPTNSELLTDQFCCQTFHHQPENSTHRALKGSNGYDHIDEMHNLRAGSAEIQYSSFNYQSFHGDASIFYESPGLSSSSGSLSAAQLSSRTEDSKNVMTADHHKIQRSLSSSLLTAEQEANLKVKRCNAEEKKEKIAKYRAKRFSRCFEKVIKYPKRQEAANRRHRQNGRFAGYEEKVNEAESCSTTVDMFEWSHGGADHEEVEALLQDEKDLRWPCHRQDLYH